MKYWLMKSEPSSFSIDDLKAQKSTLWDGVRNYQARNFMMKEMKAGDLVLFYHSNADPAAAVGVAQVSGPAEPDLTALDPDSNYFDPKATPGNPNLVLRPDEVQEEVYTPGQSARNERSPRPAEDAASSKRQPLVSPACRPERI